MNPLLQARPENFILRIPVKHLGEPMTTLRSSRADDGTATVSYTHLTLPTTPYV